MEEVPVDPDRVLALARAQAKHLLAWARSDAGRSRFEANVDAALETLLRTPVAELVRPDEVRAALERALTPAVVEGALRPAVRASALLVVARLCEEERPVAAFVPEAARRDLDRLAEARGVVPERLVREVLRHQAVGEVLRDVLAVVLREFSEKVNPFLADGGLPALGKLLPLGFGGVGRVLAALRTEFEKRLEPETKRFVDGATRFAVDRFVDFTVARLDEPEFVKLRRRLVAFVLEQPLSTWVAPPDDPRTALGIAIADAVVGHVAGLGTTRDEWRAALELAVKAHGKQTLRVALAAYGIVEVPDAEARRALAAALWPAVEVLAASPAVEEALVEGLAASLGPALIDVGG